jgi:hypothetical protein
VSYRWLRNDEVSRRVLRLRGAALGDFFRVREALEDDPRASHLCAAPLDGADWPDAWSVPFGNGGLLVYRIFDEDPPSLKPLYLDPPATTEADG